MKLYHTTIPTAAEKIKNIGFKNGAKTYGTSNMQYGVFFSNKILNSNQGVAVDSKEDPECVFIVNFPEKEIQQYEWVQEGFGGYREWCIPAEVVNRFFTDRAIYSWYDDTMHNDQNSLVKKMSPEKLREFEEKAKKIAKKLKVFRAPLK